MLFVVELGLHRVLVIWQALLLTMLDHTAADIIAMRSENALSLVTRSCRESLPVWSSSVYGSRSPRPRTHCAGEFPLSSMAELQAQVTAVSQVTRCSCSSTSSRRACASQIPPCRSQTAFCCGLMAAVGMGSHPRSSSSCPNSRSNSPP